MSSKKPAPTRGFHAVTRLVFVSVRDDPTRGFRLDLRMVFRARSVRLAASLVVLFAPAARPAPRPRAADMATAGRTFLATLSPKLRAQAVLPFEDPDRTNWRYVPGHRLGVSLKEMNAFERDAARALLQSGLSTHGYKKTAGVIELEEILREIDTSGLTRDPELYWVTFFGAPGKDALWGWRFEGHHLSINFSSTRGEALVSTPAFFGANPARVPGGPRAGWRVLASEEDLARRLLATLTPGERRRAVISESAPADILLGPNRRLPPEPAGLPASEMRSASRELLRLLLAAYVENARPQIAAARWKRIEAADAGKVLFAWAGSASPGRGHYYRIHGPTFVVEYDNTQNDANHVHSVWHDLGNVTAADLLRRHYEEDPHHAVARTNGRPPRKLRRPHFAAVRPESENFARGAPSPSSGGAGCADYFSWVSSPPPPDVSRRMPPPHRTPLPAPFASNRSL